MSDAPRRSGGARLPLALLVGFLALVGGLVVWLSLFAPEPGIEPRKPDTTAEAPPPRPLAGGPEPAAETPSTADPEPEAAQDSPQRDTEERAPPTPPEAHGTAPPAPAVAPETAQGEAESSTGESDGEQATGTGHASGKETEEPAAPEPVARAERPAPPEPVAETPTAQPAPAPAAPKTDAASQPVMTARLPPVPADTPLKPAPDPDLVQKSSLGPLPRMSADGRAPWRVYAKPFDRADRRPRVAIVISGLGLSAAATESAIQGLPGAVTLAFAPYSGNLEGWIRLARAAGHEVLLNVPMEPSNYPAYDPGPQTLLTSLNEQGNLDRLLWILSRGSGYVGVLDFMGSRFTASRTHMEPVLAALKQRGLLFLDSGSAVRGVSQSVSRDVGIPWAIATLTLDDRASRTQIDKKFSELERRAKQTGRAIGIGSPYPVTLERVATWSRQLEARGFAVAPVSALVEIGQPAENR